MFHAYKRFTSFPLLILAAGLCAARAGAVGVSAGYEFFPYSHISNIPAGSTLNNGEIRQTKIYGAASLPMFVFRGGKTVLANSLYAEKMSLYYRDFTPGTNEVEDFYGANYSLTWIETINRDWRTVTTLTPGFYYDGHDESRNSWLLQGGVTVLRTVWKGFQAGGGVAVVNEFGDPRVVPTFVVTYNVAASTAARPEAGSHVVEVVAPLKASYFYVLARSLQLGAVGQVSGGKYSLTQGSLKNDSVSFSVGTIGASLRILPTDKVFFEVTAGGTVNRRFEVYSGKSEVGRFDLKNSSFLRLAANVTF